MGLAASNYRLLALTARKSDLEFGLNLCSMQKMQLTREMSQLTQQYNADLSRKELMYYANGKYNKINYGYLMGYGSSLSAFISGSKPLKENKSMILADSSGRVVISDCYARAMMDVLGSTVMDGYGRGGTFSTDKIPEILAKLFPCFTADQYRDGVENYTWNATEVNALTGEEGDTVVINTAGQANDIINNILNFYYPIFQAAASNGWTTEYNQQMSENDNYINDMFNSGAFQLVSVNEYGQYDMDKALNYFLTAGDVEARTDADTREVLTQKYNMLKEDLNSKETLIDMQMEDYNTELNAIKTQMESINSFIKDAIQSVFNWGTA